MAEGFADLLDAGFDGTMDPHDGVPTSRELHFELGLGLGATWVAGVVSIFYRSKIMGAKHGEVIAGGALAASLLSRGATVPWEKPAYFDELRGREVSTESN